MADDKESVEKTIAEDLVVTKYKLAGEIVNSKLKDSWTIFPHLLFCGMNLSGWPDVCPLL